MKPISPMGKRFFYPRLPWAVSAVPLGASLAEASLSRHGWSLEESLLFRVPKELRPSGGWGGEKWKRQAVFCGFSGVS